MIITWAVRAREVFESLALQGVIQEELIKVKKRATAEMVWGDWT